MICRNVLIVACLGLVGCQQHYYRVTDVATGKEFYTKGWLESFHRARGGGIHFQDLGTGDHVELQSAQIRQVSEQDALAAPRK